MTGPPFITRVRIQGYKSIKACDVELGELSILVGPNGSGKSNFLDALRFVSDALSSTLECAIVRRLPNVGGRSHRREPFDHGCEPAAAVT
jgi:predicted ATPase